MDVLVSGLGGLLVLVTLRDIFRTLWHPAARGNLSRLATAAVWKLSGVGDRGRLAAVTGPFAMVIVVGMWFLLVVAGWTLVYWPHLPEAFVYDRDLDPEDRGDLLDALYLSVVTLGTLGFGDIVPHEPWLRVVVPLQALVGFVLATAAVSWVLQITPALNRRRTLATRLSHLRRAEFTASLSTTDGVLAAQIVESLAGELARVRVDLHDYEETYYFLDNSAEECLPLMLDYVMTIAELGKTSHQPDLRLAAAVLENALTDLARSVDEHFLRTGGDTTEILRTFALDHGRGVGGE